MSSRPPLFTIRFLRLLAFVFVTFSSAFQLFPTMPFRIIELGGSTVLAGSFLAIYTWSSALTAPFTGTIADQLGRKRVLLVSATGFLLFSTAYAFVTNITLLLTLALIHGVLWSGMLSASGGLLTSIIPESRNVEGIGYYGMAPTLALAGAPALGLVLFERWGWFSVCASMAVLSAVALFLSSMVRDDHRSSDSWPRLSSMVDWRVVLVASSLMVCAFGYGGLTSYVAIYSLEIGVRPTSIFFVAMATIIIITRIFITPLGDRYGALKLLYPTLLLVPPAMGVLAFVPSSSGVLLAAVLFGVGFGSIYPSLASAILSLIPQRRHAATFGSILLALDVGIGSGSIVTGWLVQQSSWRLTWSFAGALSLFALPAFLLTYPLLRRRSEQVTPSGT